MKAEKVEFEKNTLIEGLSDSKKQILEKAIQDSINK
jgi:hypothetical protein